MLEGNSEGCKHKYRQTERQMEGPTDRLTERKEEGQTDKQSVAFMS